jgi:hypothetical protein
MFNSIDGFKRMLIGKSVYHFYLSSSHENHVDGFFLFDRLLVAYTEMWNTTSPSQEETEWLFAPNYYV